MGIGKRIREFQEERFGKENLEAWDKAMLEKYKNRPSLLDRIFGDRGKGDR